MRVRNGPVVARSANNDEDRPSMGVTYVTVQVGNLAKQGAPYVAEFLVDTGSIDCMAPADVLEAAGIVREGKKVYELADGKPVEFDYGFARVSFLGDETVAQVVFGPPDTEPLLGVVALENTGVVVDPVTRELTRMHARPLKRALGEKAK
jgi:clan AA aspartic protease